MINWRTSRFLLLFFLLLLAVVGVAVSTRVDVGNIAEWRTTFSNLRQSASLSPSPSPTPVAGPGQAVALPRYPTVQIVQPAVSIFDPAA